MTPSPEPSEGRDDRVADPTGDAAVDDLPAPDVDDDATGVDGASELLEETPDPAEQESIEAERQERLDPEHRPEGAEVDNSPRDFDPEKGMFTDSEGYAEAPAQFPAAGEQEA